MEYKQIGDAVLINGDCLEVMPMLIEQGVKVNAVIADIPYFNVVKNEWDNQWETLSDYLKWINCCFDYCYKLLKENGSLLIFTGRQLNRQICYELDKRFFEKRIIIWARKRSFNNTRGKALSSGYEPICYYTKNEKNYTFNNLKIKIDSKRPEYTTGYLKDGITLSDVWTDIPALPHNSKEKVNHPTQKPLKLLERCIEMVTNEGDLVLDFTMGSGTTGLACRNLNRKFIGIELDKGYFDIACKRIEEGK